MQFAQKLRQLRKEKGLTQKETAQSLVITQRTLQNYESGFCMPRSSKVARRISSFFNVEIKDLFSPEDFYLINAVERGGVKSERELSVLLSEPTALCSGGKISAEDKALVVKALNDIYWDSKEKAKEKYAPNRAKEKQ